MARSTPPAAQLAALTEQVRQLERRHRGGQRPVPAAVPAVDQGAAWPAGLFRRGTVVEWIGARPGCGAATLAWHLAWQACRSGHADSLVSPHRPCWTPPVPAAVVALDSDGEFYPPAVVNHQGRLRGTDAHLLVIRPSHMNDLFWSMEQTLRCPAVVATVARVDRLDDHTFRRLQLAAGEGEGMAILWRPAAARRQPSWADVRLWVEPRKARGRHVRVELLRGQGRGNHRVWEWELDDEAGIVRVVAGMADAAGSVGTARGPAPAARHRWSSGPRTRADRGPLPESGGDGRAASYAGG